MSKRLILNCIFALTVAAVLSSCDKNSSDDPPRKLTTTKAAQEKVKTGVFDFSLDIFREASKTSDANSFMISPLSLATALAMTEGGAAGTTAEEMKSVLGFSEATQDDFAAYFKDIFEQIREADSSVEVKVANSIWSDTQFPVLDDFKEFSEYYYDAAIRTRDFKSQSTADEINAWCSEKTNGKIMKITELESLKCLRMCLLNALYFNAKWSFEFNGASDRIFHCYDESQKMVPLMSKNNSYKYASADGFTFVEIPYGKNGSFVFDLILPKEGDDIFNSIMNLTGDKFRSLVSGARPVEMILSMPKFKMEYTTEKFIGNLEALGMKKAFCEQADFSAISPISTLISCITQKTYIDVTETGTEAAAVTLVGVTDASIGEPPITVTVDRPYVFAIREINSGAILFIGAIVKF